MQAITETFNRTAKLALDDGSAATLDDALRRFASFRVQLVIGKGVAHNRALQAAVLTVLNAAPRTFLGGVVVTGDTDIRFDLAWFTGQTLSQTLPVLGGRVAAYSATIPTIVFGDWAGPAGPFCIFVSCTGRGFIVNPDCSGESCADAPVQCGVAVAGVALSEVFQHLYFARALAGKRHITVSLPELVKGPHGSSPKGDAWVIGLGHLGQAALWTLCLAGVQPKDSLRLRLQDYDHITPSSLSTCLLAWGADVGKLKVDVVSERLSSLGVGCDTIAERLEFDDLPRKPEPASSIVAVDNVSFRRGLDKLPGLKVVEAGIGDGIKAFTRVQLHVFPGPRKAADVWAEADSRATRMVSIQAPGYQDLLRKTGDECGTTLLAGRSIATPFVGAFAGACLFNLWALGEPHQSSSHAWNLDVTALN